MHGLAHTKAAGEVAQRIDASKALDRGDDASAALGELAQLWTTVPPRPANARNIYYPRWRTSDGARLRFNTVVATWSDFDAEGRPSFSALQPRMHVGSASQAKRLAAQTPVTYMIFDLLWLDGHSLMDLPYTERRGRLAGLHAGKNAGTARGDGGGGPAGRFA